MMQYSACCIGLANYAEIVPLGHIVSLTIVSEANDRLRDIVTGGHMTTGPEEISSTLADSVDL
jgi:hypothetical protein